MSSDRINTTLGEIVEFKRGYDLPANKRRDGAYAIISSSGVSGSHDEAKAKAPGVVTGRYGTIGELFYIKDDYWPLNTALYVRDFKGNLPRFIYYFLHSVIFAQFSDKSSVPGVNRNHLHALEVSFERNRDRQRTIAKILGDLDDKITLLREINATLEEIARAVFRAWFVDFAPVRAKVAGATSFRGMPPTLFDQLPDSFTPSELGDIPTGWKVGRVGDVVELNRISVKPFEHPDEVYQHFSLPAFDLDQEPDFDLGSSIKSGKYVIPSGAILFSKLNPRIPRVWWPKPASPDYMQIASTEFLVCLPREGWSRSYAYCLFTQTPFIEGLTKQASGTSNSHQRITPGQFESVSIPIPPQSLCQGFLEFATPLLEHVIDNRVQRGTLAAFRDTLLPKLISGELPAPALGALGLRPTKATDSSDG